MSDYHNTMKLKILGSGAWEGIPVPFCKCKICEFAQKPKSKDNRTRPQILVDTEKGQFLIEISPDIRIQSTKFNLPDISNFLISHWHFDHMYGLLELHAWVEFVLGQKPKLFCSQKTKELLDKNFAHIPKDIVVIKPFEKFDLFDIKITPLPVYHMNWQDKDVTEEELNNTFGFVLENNGKKAVYLADYYKMPNKSLEIIKNSDVIVADGTYLFEEMFPSKPEQNNLKFDPDHLHGKQILDFVDRLNAKKVIFHSISHLTEESHEELQKLLPKNMFISYDGMELEL